MIIKDYDIVNLDLNFYVDKIHIINCKRIKSLNIKCNSLIIESKYYYNKDKLIFDKNDNLQFILTDSSIDELIEYSEKYSIGLNAIHYFSNAYYVQYFKEDGFSIRISNNRHLKKDEPFVVLPKKINNLPVKTLYIGSSLLKYLYIPKYLKNIILEVPSEYKYVIIKDNNYFKIRNYGICKKYTNEYIHFQGEVFRLHDKPNLKLKYEPKKRFVKDLIKGSVKYEFNIHN